MRRPFRAGRGFAFALFSASLVVGFALGCQDSIDDRLTEAFELQETGELELSILAIEEILRENPDNDQANFLLGTSLVQSDRRKRAIPHLQAAAASDLYAVPAGLLLASTQYRIKAYEDAIASCEDILAIDSANLTAIYTLGLSYLASGQPDKALSQANQILEVKPTAQNAIILQGGALVDLGRADEAEAIWIGLRKRTASGTSSPDAARACAELALFYQSQRNFARADQVYVECLSDYPTHAYLQDSASDFYVARAEPARAIAVHKQAADSSPDNFQVWSRLAGIMYLHADPTSTHEMYLGIVERFDSPEAWRLIADFYQKTRHTTAARRAIEEALIRSDNPPEAFLYSLAELLVEEGNLDRAQKIGERLTKPSYRNLLSGAINLANGNAREALNHLDIGLRLWPNNPNARYLAGRAARELYDHPRALAAYGAAITVGSGTTDAPLRLAEIHFADGNFQPARGFAKHQIAHRPYLDESPYRIAIRSALRLNRPADARTTLESLRVLAPDNLAIIAETIAIERYEGGAKAATAFVQENGIDLSNPANETILRAYSNDLNVLGRGVEALRLVDAALARLASEGSSSTAGAALHDLRARILSQIG